MKAVRISLVIVTILVGLVTLSSLVAKASATAARWTRATWAQVGVSLTRLASTPHPGKLIVF